MASEQDMTMEISSLSMTEDAIKKALGLKEEDEIPAFKPKTGLGRVDVEIEFNTDRKRITSVVSVILVKDKQSKQTCAFCTERKKSSKKKVVKYDYVARIEEYRDRIYFHDSKGVPRIKSPEVGISQLEASFRDKEIAAQLIEIFKQPQFGAAAKKKDKKTGKEIICDEVWCRLNPPRTLVELGDGQVVVDESRLTAEGQGDEPQTNETNRQQDELTTQQSDEHIQERQNEQNNNEREKEKEKMARRKKDNQEAQGVVDQPQTPTDEQTTVTEPEQTQITTDGQPGDIFSLGDAEELIGGDSDESATDGDHADEEHVGDGDGHVDTPEQPEIPEQPEPTGADEPDQPEPTSENTEGQRNNDEGDSTAGESHDDLGRPEGDGHVEGERRDDGITPPPARSRRRIKTWKDFSKRDKILTFAVPAAVVAAVGIGLITGGAVDMTEARGNQAELNVRNNSENVRLIDQTDAGYVANEELDNILQDSGISTAGDRYAGSWRVSGNENARFRAAGKVIGAKAADEMVAYGENDEDLDFFVVQKNGNGAVVKDENGNAKTDVKVSYPVNAGADWYSSEAFATYLKDTVGFTDNQANKFIEGYNAAYSSEINEELEYDADRTDMPFAYRLELAIREKLGLENATEVSIEKHKDENTGHLVYTVDYQDKHTHLDLGIDFSTTDENIILDAVGTCEVGEWTEVKDPTIDEPIGGNEFTDALDGAATQLLGEEAEVIYADGNNVFAVSGNDLVNIEISAGDEATTDEIVAAVAAGTVAGRYEAAAKYFKGLNVPADVANKFIESDGHVDGKKGEKDTVQVTYWEITEDGIQKVVKPVYEYYNVTGAGELVSEKLVVLSLMTDSYVDVGVTVSCPYGKKSQVDKFENNRIEENVEEDVEETPVVEQKATIRKSNSGRNM